MTDRFSRDVLWNVASLAIAGVCGILLNYLIGVYYDATALGVFNQVFAFYLIYSQLAALGMHYSALRSVAATDDPDERRAITVAALLVTGGTAVVFAGVFAASASVVGRMLDSPEVTTGIWYAAPGVFCFGLSKVVLACLNGRRRMRLFAVFTGGRFVIMLVAFLGCALTHASRASLPVVLSIAEGATLLLALPTIAGDLGRVPIGKLRTWGREHLRFGLRGFMSGMLSELNTRVDVLMLGIFVDDNVVGAYSFAAILAEGIFQLLVVLRSNFAPILIRLWTTDRLELAATVKRIRDRTYLGSVVVGGGAVLGYVIVVPLVTREPALAASWPYFAALVAGMVASAGYAPVQPLLLYAGKPGWHTILMLGIVMINVVLNVPLIWAWGAMGSSVATAFAFVMGAVWLKVLVRRELEISI